MLLIFETHPIQYHAPVYRYLQQELGVPVMVAYGSDFSVAGYRDKDFNTTFSWDSDLLSGYQSCFLSTVANDGVDSAQKLTGVGISKVLSEVRPTAVLLKGYGFAFHRAAFRQVRQHNYPMMMRGETTDVDQSRTLVKRLVRDTFLRWFYAQFSVLLPIGINSNAHYDRLAPAKTPRFFSPYCIDTTPFTTGENDRSHLRAATRKRLALHHDQTVILFSGKLIDKKAPELLLESIKHLSTDEREKTTVLFLGDGPLRPMLTAMAQAEPAVSVRFAGFQNQSALSPFYHASDLLVLPSRYSETWGLVVNEALHHGLPCVVSNHVGCAPDLILKGKTGEIFCNGNARELAAAIKQTIEWARTATVRHQCRTQVANYTIEKAAVGIYNAYHHIGHL